MNQPNRSRLSDEPRVAASHIRAHLAAGDYDRLKGSLSYWYAKLPATATCQRLLRDGYAALGDDLRSKGDVVEAIHAFDRARQMAPRSWDLIERELEAFQAFISDQTGDAVSRDIKILRAALINLRYTYQSGKYSRRVTEWLSDIVATLDRIEPGLAQGDRSPITAQVEQIFFSLYRDQTKTNIAEILSDILAPELILEIGQQEHEQGDQDTR